MVLTAGGGICGKRCSRNAARAIFGLKIKAQAWPELCLGLQIKAQAWPGFFCAGLLMRSVRM